MDNPDKKIPEAIKRKWTLQPSQKDEFMREYGWHPNESKKDVEKFLRRREINKKFPDFSNLNDNRNK